MRLRSERGGIVCGVFDMKFPGSELLCVVALALSGCAAPEHASETTYFPVVKYSAPDGTRFAVYLAGVTGNHRCSESAATIVDAARVNCPQCSVTFSCTGNLDAGHRTILSRDSLDMP